MSKKRIVLNHGKWREPFAPGNLMRVLYALLINASISPVIKRQFNLVKTKTHIIYISIEQESRSGKTS